MAYNYFSPKPGRLGVHPVLLTTDLNPTGGTLAAGTENHNVGVSPMKAYVNRASVCAAVYPTAATSCVATLYKMTGATAVALTQGLAISGGTADTPLIFSFLTTTTDANRTLGSGDSLRIAIVTTGAVSVQPDDLSVSVELLVME
jgi:uncharacterized MnhB-related membrane protein